MSLKPGLLILAGGGALVAVAGLKGWSLGATARDIINGQNPAKNPTLANPIAGGESTGPGPLPPIATGSGKVSISARANQAIARTLAAVQHPSWIIGQNWTDWVALWTRESDWSSTAFNVSGAYGVAQALGHGSMYAEVGPRSVGSSTPGMNASYGGYGLSPASARAANAGHALPQIQWGIGYIASVYGSPSAAWAHETSAGWY